MEPGSVLAINFSNNNGYGEPSKDINGAYVIDRDPLLFNWVIRYLRFGGHLPDLPEDHLIRSVREEAFWWQLTEWSSCWTRSLLESLWQCTSTFASPD